MTRSAGSLWSKACKQLESVLSKDVYDRWIALIEAKDLTADTLTLAVANDFYQSWLEENYVPLIQDAVATVSGESLQIQLSVDHSATPTILPQKESSRRLSLPKKLQKRVSGGHLNAKYTFDTFVVGPSNHFSHAACMAVAQSPARAYNPLFIYGGVGLGKTHLMQAIGHAALSNSRAHVSYLSCEAFTNEYIDALQNKSLVEFRKKYRSTDVLLIDDVHFLAGKERMQEEFFHTFNALFDNHKQIVLTCDRPANEIPGLEHRLVSRFEWGLVTDLEIPDVETRIAILRKKQEQMNLALPEAIISFIAHRIRSNIRRLEGALIRAASYCSLTGTELTMENLEHLLRDTLDQEKQEAITIEKVQRIVADYYDIRFGDMTSKRRPQSIAFPRQVAMYLCRTMTNHSLPTIGSAFDRNHATVMHACKLVTDRIQQDGEIRRTIGVLTQKLQQK